NSVIMDGAVRGAESRVAAMSFVTAGFRGENRQLLMGTPARAVRTVSDDKLHWKLLNTKENQDLVGRCHASLHETQPLRQM
ncbi:phenylacetic acid degradation protein PaaY, partial [Escherichia coli]